MTAPFDLVIENVRDIGGQSFSVGMAGGKVTACANRIAGAAPRFDGRGGTIIAGLHDHHVHLMATAAARASVDLSGCRDRAALEQALRSAGPGAWIRAVGYDERAAGLPDCLFWDEILADRPLRVQDRTGALWMLNSAALDRIGAAARDCDGGRIWREDAWLRERIGVDPPDLAALGRELSSFGVTGVTDATAHNGAAEAALLTGAVPQRLRLMGRPDLAPGPGYAVDAVKLHFDERALPPLADVAAMIREARGVDRNVAAHCVTDGEIVFYLAALDEAGGARAGDRVEHGGIIPAEMIPLLRRLGLLVVTQPGFVDNRGDRYRDEVAADAMADLYRAASLLADGVALLGGSDSPYGPIDPWRCIRAAMTRRTAMGAILGADERLGWLPALRLYSPVTLRPGMDADLCLLAPDASEVTMAGGNPVRACWIGGALAWSDSSAG